MVSGEKNDVVISGPLVYTFCEASPCGSFAHSFCIVLVKAYYALQSSALQQGFRKTCYAVLCDLRVP